MNEGRPVSGVRLSEDWLDDGRNIKCVATIAGKDTQIRKRITWAKRDKNGLLNERKAKGN